MFLIWQLNKDFIIIEKNGSAIMSNRLSENYFFCILSQEQDQIRLHGTDGILKFGVLQAMNPLMHHVFRLLQVHNGNKLDRNGMKAALSGEITF